MFICSKPYSYPWASKRAAIQLTDRWRFTSSPTSISPILGR